MTIDLSLCPQDKAVRYFCYLEHVFLRVFTLGAQDLTIRDMKFSL